MERGLVDDLAAFATVARERSFTRAAAVLDLSTSALSLAVKRLERRLDLRLLNRNSRGVAATEAGEQLLARLGPALSEIEAAVEDISREQGRVAGTVRITATQQGYEAVIRPVLAAFGAAHPEATVEVLIDYEFRDIVASGLDAGIRLGEKLEQDMIALAVGPRLRMAVVAAPAYLAVHPAPADPEGLAAHRCINYRLRAGGLMPWAFERDGRRLEVRVRGPLTVTEPEIALAAAVDGLGVAYVLEERAALGLADGRLVEVLRDWMPDFSGWFLYHPSRWRVPPTLAALIEALRHRATASRRARREDDALGDGIVAPGSTGLAGRRP